VLDRVARRVGGRLRAFISGGGALARDTAEFFGSLGLPILEGYGLSETSPVLCINRHGAVRPGTVGPPIPGVEIRIAEDGEILARGPNVMLGYLNRPADTAEVLRDGWLATGDVGELDPEGCLRITDRKKDLFKTTGGKYVAPQRVENLLKRDPRILNAVVVGSGRRHPAALIVPVPGATREALGDAVDAVNRGLELHERVRAFAVLDRDFSLDAGEITPTLKVKRRVVERKHAALIDSLYRD
jgi:long-chain acyl-CoA synthetase